MKIINKFRHEQSVCFTVDEGDGFLVYHTLRGLYAEDVLEGLKKEGYKIFDYHGNIVTPDGICILDLVEESCIISESDICTMYDLETLALSEPEATAYFSRLSEMKKVELKQPRVEIATRSELIRYLMEWSRKERLGLGVNDVRPLNSFVANEALFSLDEIQKDDSLRFYLDIIQKRRELKNYEQVESLVSFLQAEGVLQEKYTANDIKCAYLSWGICGLRDSVVEQSLSLGVAKTIFSDAEAVNAESNKYIEKAIMDRKGVVYTSIGEFDALECEDISQLPIKFASDKEFYKYIHSANSWGCEYQAIDVLIGTSYDRTFMTLMSEDGFMYKAKVDHNTLVIDSATSLVLIQKFLIVKLFDGTEMTIDKALNRDAYEKWSTCYLRAVTLNNLRTVKPAFESSRELLEYEGLSPYGIVRYAARRVKDEPVLNASFQSGVDFRDAAEIYRKGPDEKYISKYNPDNESYDTYDELISIMLAKRDELEASGEYLSINKDDMGHSAVDAKEELLIRPVDQLEFASNILDGSRSFDNLGSGLLADGIAKIWGVTVMLHTLCETVLGKNAELASIQSFLQEIENSKDYIDYTQIIRKRDRAYKGAIKDRAVLNALRAAETMCAIYVTRVYREAANLPAEEQRHYMFDCIGLKLYPKASSPAVRIQKTVAESVKSSVAQMKDIPDVYREAISIQAEAAALELMFLSAFSGKTFNMENGNYILPYKYEAIEEDCSYVVPVPVSVSIYNEMRNTELYDIYKCCSLYTWCKNEFRGDLFKLYCLNANITPWEVRPKKGVNLFSYNFALNYVQDSVLANFSDEFQAKVKEQNAKVTNLYITGTNELLEIYDTDPMARDYTADTINIVLEPDVPESVTAYYKRFSLQNNAAKTRGECLKRMALKSDYVYGNYDKNPNAFTDIAEYTEMQSKSDANRWITTIDVLPISDGWTKNAIEMSINNIERFVINEHSYSDAGRWSALIYNSYRPTGAVIVYGTHLVCVTAKGRIERDLKTISAEDCTKLAEKGLAYQIGARKFLFRSNTGDYSVEVR